MKIRCAHPDVRGSVELLRVVGEGNRIEFQIACFEGQIHRVVWGNGRVRILDHTPDDKDANRAFRALGGPPYPCFLMEEWLATGIYFES
jgi:hypothetical protein